jgi:hypothetical protein
MTLRRGFEVTSGYSGVPRLALETLQVANGAADACSLCAQGIPVVKPGPRPA